MNLTELITIGNIATALVGILAALVLIVYYLQHRDGRHGPEGGGR